MIGGWGRVMISPIFLWKPVGILYVSMAIINILARDQPIRSTVVDLLSGWLGLICTWFIATWMVDPSSCDETLRA